MISSLPGWVECGHALAVLPSLFTIGPLALLAWLFPATFGGLALFLRRGIVFCTVLTSISTLYLAQATLRGPLAGTWWATPSAFWLCSMGVAGAGLAWTSVRPRNRSVVNKPGVGAVLILGLFSVAGLGIAAMTMLSERAQIWRDLLPLCAVVWAGFACVVWQEVRSDPAGRFAAFFTVERSMLGALILACTCALLTSTPARQQAGMEIAWAFEPIERGAIVSTPLIAGRVVYVGAIRDGMDRSRGAVFAVDRSTGKAVWHLDDDGHMLNMYSTPCLNGGRLFIGEGMHGDFDCKLYCLDAANGHKLWEFQASSHIESSPIVANGKVYVGAGDDGLYCLDAVTGKQLWNFRDGLHIDASPVAVGNSIYASSGISRRYRTTQIFCLNADTGQVRWRQDTDLPAWGSPLIVGERIYFGLGNGRLLISVAPPEKPAGALLCVAANTGETLYRYSVSDGVLARAAADAERVYFTSRDGFCYALNHATGALAWRFEMNGPAVTTPALAGTHLYVVPTQGPVFCLDASTGIPKSSFDLRKWNGTDVRLLSSPAVASSLNLEPPEEIVYFGAEVRGPLGNAAVLYALRSMR